MTTTGLPQAPFIIGQVLWRVKRAPIQVTEQCDLCLGQRTVTVIDASGTAYAVECEACRSGYQSMGEVTEWRSTPAVEKFVIGSVVAYRDGEWTVRSATDDAQMDFKYLFATHDEAWAEAERQCEGLRENNWGQRKRRRENALQRAASTLAYHRRQVSELEKKLAWHREKISAAK